MTIAIEAQRIFRKKRHGMDIVALELIRNLQVIDKENEYYIYVRKDEDRCVLSETANFHIIELPHVPYPVWEQVYLPIALKKIKPDILHCTSNTAPLRCNSSLILTLHDIIFMDPPKKGGASRYQRYGNMYRRWLVPQLINRSSSIITVSNFEKQKIERYFSLSREQINTVYNGYTDIFKKIKNKEALEKYKKKYKLPDNFLLFLGNTDPKKNVKNVLKAFKVLFHRMNGNISLVMPDANEDFLNRTLADTDSSTIKEAIHLTGYIPNDELVYIYNMASVFLYPSLYESFGIPILEAMACGVPVITSNVAAMPEIAGGAAKAINPENPEAIAQAIEHLLKNDALKQKYIRAGLKRINSFGWKSTAKNMLRTYEETYQNARDRHFTSNEPQLTQYRERK